MTACQKESVGELSENQPSIENDLAEVYINNETGPIEYVTLEELNQALIDNGLEPVTLEELGVTQEEYAAAQARVA